VSKGMEGDVGRTGKGIWMRGGEGGGGKGGRPIMTRGGREGGAWVGTDEVEKKDAWNVGGGGRTEKGDGRGGVEREGRGGDQEERHGREMLKGGAGVGSGGK